MAAPLSSVSAAGQDGHLGCHAHCEQPECSGETLSSAAVRSHLERRESAPLEIELQAVVDPSQQQREQPQQPQQQQQQQQQEQQREPEPRESVTGAGGRGGVLFGLGGMVRGVVGEARWRRRYECAIRQAIGELLGTLLLVFCGTGSVAVAVSVAGAAHGIWQVASVWGVAVTVAILVAAPYSGAHLNPAVSLSFLLCRPRAFTVRQLAIYVCAQFVGALLGGALSLLCFSPLVRGFEEHEGISRGSAASVHSAMTLAEYFPNPSVNAGYHDELYQVSVGHALFAEALSTAILCFVIFALTDTQHQDDTISHRSWTPYIIGLTVALLISLFGSLTMCGMNPARDFAPRLVAAMAGWGSVAIPGPHNGFWVYIVGPLLGGPLGALFYTLLRWLTLTDQDGPRCGVDSSPASTACRPIGRVVFLRDQQQRGLRRRPPHQQHSAQMELEEEEEACLLVGESTDPRRANW